ncbi:hypothetical protein SK128_010931 [Halocaridina rubra]|uniref:Uncharacterized protein n=1 Tax=Halocaridina rubra TaxID=373956 RepID=A0AAN8ZVW9_HALRR
MRKTVKRKKAFVGVVGAEASWRRLDDAIQEAQEDVRSVKPRHFKWRFVLTMLKRQETDVLSKYPLERS